jgi:uncharacterized membrane protein
MHFIRPDFFESIVPDWIPDAKAANYVSGAAEIGFGLALLPGRTSKWAALGLLTLTAVVFPANIDMAVNNVEVKPVDGKMTRSVGTATGSARVVNWVRLPLQLPLGYAIWHISRNPD